MLRFGSVCSRGHAKGYPIGFISGIGREGTAYVTQRDLAVLHPSLLRCCLPSFLPSFCSFFSFTFSLLCFRSFFSSLLFFFFLFTSFHSLFFTYSLLFFLHFFSSFFSSLLFFNLDTSPLQGVEVLARTMRACPHFLALFSTRSGSGLPVTVTLRVLLVNFHIKNSCKTSSTQKQCLDRDFSQVHFTFAILLSYIHSHREISSTLATR